ncbi:hypothetical protein BN159_p19 (plasmid) [Streptomyces davaonensis JCM 4913]|uniref:Uncharacterized protein n=1 Tax=Streptomyces davaonensis (strain DSM 101723 / JCM 4913 / KCC S-0913 / 768) TaxID=1214101 RepID=K4RGM1_STRDJ|nr:hypothetical protein [Streptomyces davaonensis]CCK32900.1 hypothetical protein BN159_p19 [Streptomyces davaonensis JCM 4913]
MHDCDQVAEYLFERDDFIIGSGKPGDMPGGAIPPADVLVAITLAPFVTAVVASLGTGLGQRIEGAAVRILRHVPRSAILRRSPRLLRAQVEAGDAVAEEETGDSAPSTLTVTTEGGTRIHLSTRTPVDALTLLPDVDFTDVEELGDVPATVRWLPGWPSDRWHAVSIKDGHIVDVEWDPETRRWVTVRF